MSWAYRSQSFDWRLLKASLNIILKFYFILILKYDCIWETHFMLYDLFFFPLRGLLVRLLTSQSLGFLAFCNQLIQYLLFLSSIQVTGAQDLGKFIELLKVI